MPKTKDIKQHLSISMHASLREAKHVSGSASALFIGGFSVVEMDKVMTCMTCTIKFSFSYS